MFSFSWSKFASAIGHGRSCCSSCAWTAVETTARHIEVYFPRTLTSINWVYFNMLILPVRTVKAFDYENNESRQLSFPNMLRITVESEKKLRITKNNPPTTTAPWNQTAPKSPLKTKQKSCLLLDTDVTHLGDARGATVEVLSCHAKEIPKGRIDSCKRTWGANIKKKKADRTGL